MAFDLVQAAVGELPLIVRVPMEIAGEITQALVESPLTAVSLAPPRGTLIDKHGGTVRGRLFGPAVFPLALAHVQDVVECGVPVIAAGGVYEPWQAEALMEAGAIGVQLEAVFWIFGWQRSGE
jgi:dihydroorotate dehydrogenase